MKSSPQEYCREHRCETRSCIAAHEDPPGLTDKEIQDRYLDHLEQALVGNEWMGKIYPYCELRWACVNHADFLFPGGYALDKRALDFFASSDTLWAYPSVTIIDGKRAISITLVDWFSRAKAEASNV